MNDLIDPKIQITDRSFKKRLFVNNDNQDWESEGIKDVQEEKDSE